MKITLLICLTLFHTCCSIAQKDPITSKDINLKHSEPYGLAEEGIPYVFNSDNFLYKVIVSGKNYTQLLFQKSSLNNLNMETLASYDITQESTMSKNAVFESIEFINKKYYLLYSIFDTKSPNEELFVQELNLDKGGFIGNPKLILTINEKLQRPSYSNSPFSIFYTKSSDFINLDFTYLQKDKNLPPEKGIIVFDSSLSVLTQTRRKMPVIDDLIEMNQHAMDSKGNLYSMLFYSDEKATKANEEDPKFYKLLISKFTPNGQQEDFAVEIGNHIINDARIVENGKGEIACVGYYREPTFKTINGIFSFCLGQSGKLSEPILYEFKDDYIKQYNKYTKEGEISIADKVALGTLGIDNLSLRFVEKLSDGTILLTGEESSSSTSTSAVNSYSSGTTTSYYGEITLAKIGVTGEIQWIKKVPRTSYYDSFVQVVLKDDILIIFKDDIDNEDVKETESPYSANSENAVIAYQVKIEDASHEYLTLFNLKKIDDLSLEKISISQWKTSQRAFFKISDYAIGCELKLKKKTQILVKIEF